MRKLVIGLVASLAVFVSMLAPVSALATPYNVSTRGYGLKSADIEAYGLYEWYAAIGPNKPFVRASFDRCHGNPANFNIGGKVNDFASQGVHILPVITWSDNEDGNPNNDCYSGIPKNIDTTAEKNEFQAWAHYVAGVIGYVEAANGLPQTNLYEIWNEPNGNTGGNYSLANYHNNVYLPGRTGVREVDGDAGTIYGGLCFGVTSNCGQDAGTWIDGVYNAGYGGINGFGIHPYGGGSWSTAALQIVGTCQRIGNDSRSVWVTETGKSSLGTSQGEADQKTFLDNLDNTSGPRTFINWIGEDQTPTGSGSKGLLRTNGSAKPAWTYWNTLTFNYAGDTNTHC